MDEVDNIIVHSLRQIGCNIDEDVTKLSSFSPELLVETVSKCLLLIKPTLELPGKLPTGMAQRYSVTTLLAEACTGIGFRGDIGYQTFLYSNVTEVRRVFMFLIERLPKETEKIVVTHPTDKQSLLEHEISTNINLQLTAAWTPQYCKKYGIRKFGSIITIQGSNYNFYPQKLNVPFATKSNVPQELREYWLKRSPTIFQQTKSNNLCSSLIHKNDIDCCLHRKENFDKLIKVLRKEQEAADKNSNKPIAAVRTSLIKKSARDDLKNIKSIQQLTLNEIEIPNQNDIVSLPEINTVDILNFDIEKLKQSIEQCVIDRKNIMTKISDLKELKAQEEKTLSKLKENKKINERTKIVLQDPETKIAQMLSALNANEDRLRKLNEQWIEHRQPLIERLEKSKNASSSKYSPTKTILDQIKSTREKIEEISDDLKNKISIYSQFSAEFEKIDKNINRSAYTSRILEIIENIRKQKNDIDKVLVDTRELQKEINTISGQLDRQFTVTDDLLFKTAKKDEYTKKCYKLLASLHSDCNDLVQLVQDTGAVMREVRDIEDQIEQEKTRNITSNLEKITKDLKLVEMEGKDLQEKIKKFKESNK